jgi:CheY-like chemotaxis protein
MKNIIPTQKLNCILLVDDDEADNEFHSIIIEEAEVAYSIKNANSAKLGLKYLNSIQGSTDKFVIPDLIFLDINMPGMTGFEFLQKCCENHLLDTISPVIIMLTTSVNPNDKITAEEKFAGLVKGFRVKPLTEKMLDGIMSEFFGNREASDFSGKEISQNLV